jgi:hypothetical protein
VGRGIRDICNALKLGCGITVTCERFTGTVKQEDILKPYEIDQKNVLYHLLPGGI